MGMNTYEFERGAELNLPPNRIFDFLKNVKLLLNLAPYFEVKKIEKVSDKPFSEGVGYKLELVDDVTGSEENEEMTIEEYQEDRRITWAFSGNERRVIFEIEPHGKGSRLMLREVYRLSEEIKSGQIDRLSRDHQLWVRSIAQYLRLYENNSLYRRVVRYIMEKFWLPMTPSQRRIGLLIVLIQGLILLAFIFGGLMLYLKAIIEGLL